MSIASKLKSAGIKKPEKRAPLWQGPESDGENGGITQSMIARWLTCRERARVKYIEGWEPADRFDNKREYGHMWHTCEESLSKQESSEKQCPIQLWPAALKDYAAKLCAKYPLDQEKIEHWYNVCKVQFPIYVAHWSKRKGPKTESLFEEQVFKVPYRLPSGRTVYLRGKWDGGVIDRSRDNRGVWLREHKTKGDVDVMAIQRQIGYDLQTMLYLVALRVSYDLMGWAAHGPLRGVMYNVVRRPLSGGKGTIRQHKPTKANPRGESNAEFYARLSEIIAGASVEEWDTPEGENWFFHRWTAEITPDDVARFRERTLDPILENLCDWYDQQTLPHDLYLYRVKTRADNGFVTPTNWQHPFGADNGITEGYSTDLDEYLLTGSTVGLVRSESLFKELQ